MGSIRERVFKEIEEIIKSSSKGFTYSELYKELQKRLPDVHPKTLNGYLWKFTILVKENKLTGFSHEKNLYFKSTKDEPF